MSPPRSDSDYAALTTLNMILGGNFISRPYMNLPEDKHRSNGFESGLTERVGQGLFYLTSPI